MRRLAIIDLITGEQPVFNEDQSVAVVLNGQSHLSPKTHQAHDYALHRFAAESDFAIDAAAADSESLLRRALANVTK